eukprot:gene30695-35722_t
MAGDEGREDPRADGGNPSELKTFVGGLSWQMSNEELKSAFSKYDPAEAMIVLDNNTQRSRGFGFVFFQDKLGMEGLLAPIDRVAKKDWDAIRDMHEKELDGRRISVVRAVPQEQTKPGTPAAALGAGSGARSTVNRERRVDRGPPRGGGDRHGGGRDRMPPAPRDRYNGGGVERYGAGGGERYPGGSAYPDPRYAAYERGGYSRPASDPYARDPYEQRDPYAQRDPYGRDPYARDPYAAPRDPYAQRDPYARDPYAREAYPYAPDPYAARGAQPDPHGRGGPQDPHGRGAQPDPHGRGGPQDPHGRGGPDRRPPPQAASRPGPYDRPQRR